MSILYESQPVPLRLMPRQDSVLGPFGQTISIPVATMNKGEMGLPFCIHAAFVSEPKFHPEMEPRPAEQTR